MNDFFTKIDEKLKKILYQPTLNDLLTENTLLINQISNQDDNTNLFKNLIYNYLLIKGNKPVRTFYDGPEFDHEMLHSNKSIQFKIVSDCFNAEHNDFAIEIAKEEKESGLLTTTSNFYVFIILNPPNFDTSIMALFVPTKKLLEFYKDPNDTVNTIIQNNNNINFLISYDTIQKLSSKIVDLNTGDDI